MMYHPLLVRFYPNVFVHPYIQPDDVHKVMEKYDWTQTALHHLMLGETPKVLFLHWAVTGNPKDIINQAKDLHTKISQDQHVHQHQLDRSITHGNKKHPP